MHYQVRFSFSDKIMGLSCTTGTSTAWGGGASFSFWALMGTSSSGKRTTIEHEYSFTLLETLEHLLARSIATGKPRCLPRTMMTIITNFESGLNAPENAKFSVGIPSVRPIPPKAETSSKTSAGGRGCAKILSKDRRPRVNDGTYLYGKD